MWSCQEQGKCWFVVPRGNCGRQFLVCSLASIPQAFRFAQVCSGLPVGSCWAEMWHNKVTLEVTLEVSQSVSPFLPELLIRMFFASLNSSWCRRGWYMIYGNPCGNPCDPLATSKANVWIIELSCWLLLVQQQTFDILWYMFSNVFECFYCAVSLGSRNINKYQCFQGAEISFPGNRHPTWCWRSCRLRTLGWCCRRQ